MPNPRLGSRKAHAEPPQPYYESGDSRHGTAWQVDSPLLDSALLGVNDQHITDGQYGRISLGKYNSFFVGGVCHELGHALGLPHCKESAASRAARGTAFWAANALSLRCRIDADSGYDVAPAIEQLELHANVNAFLKGGLSGAQIEKLSPRVKVALQRLKKVDSARRPHCPAPGPFPARRREKQIPRRQTDIRDSHPR